MKVKKAVSGGGPIHTHTKRKKCIGEKHVAQTLFDDGRFALLPFLVISLPQY